MTNPLGTEKDGTAMSDSKARRLLGSTEKYSIKTAKIELFTTELDVPVYADGTP